MIHLSTVHENNLTKFHRNHFIITMSDLKNASIFKEGDFNNENHFSIETCRRIFPEASLSTLSNLILTTLQIKLAEGENHFLVVFNDDNKVETFDIVNGLVHIFDLKYASSEQEKYFDILKTYAQAWTHSLLAEEKRFNKIGSLDIH